MWICQLSKHPVQTHLSDWENVEYSHDWMKSQQINSLSKTGLGIYFFFSKEVCYLHLSSSQGLNSIVMKWNCSDPVLPVFQLPISLYFYL